MSQLLHLMYHSLDGGWKFVKTKAFLKVEYRVTVGYHPSRPPPSCYTEISTKYSFLYCAPQETRNPNFLRRAFLPTFACAFIAKWRRLGKRYCTIWIQYLAGSAGSYFWNIIWRKIFFNCEPYGIWSPKSTRNPVDFRNLVCRDTSWRIPGVSFFSTRRARLRD